MTSVRLCTLVIFCLFCSLKKYLVLFISTCTFKSVFISFRHAVNLRLCFPMHLPGQQITVTRRVTNTKREIQITYSPMFSTVLSFALQKQVYFYKNVHFIINKCSEPFINLTFFNL